MVLTWSYYASSLLLTRHEHDLNLTRSLLYFMYFILFE